LPADVHLGILVLFPEWLGCSAKESIVLMLMNFPGINSSGPRKNGSQAAVTR